MCYPCYLQRRNKCLRSQSRSWLPPCDPYSGNPTRRAAAGIRLSPSDLTRRCCCRPRRWHIPCSSTVPPHGCSRDWWSVHPSEGYTHRCLCRRSPQGCCPYGRNRGLGPAYCPSAPHGRTVRPACGTILGWQCPHRHSPSYRCRRCSTLYRPRCSYIVWHACRHSCKHRSLRRSIARQHCPRPCCVSHQLPAT